MPLEARLVSGLTIALAAVYWATPVAIRVAERFAFVDKPIGYKGHAAPTPYLGGAAVVAGFVLAAAILTADWGRSLPLLTGVVVLWVVGTVDDRRNVSPLARVAVEVVLATMLWSLDLGWTLELGAGLDLAVTIVWVVAIVNAFNLFDNMDGAASTMAIVVAAGVVVLGVVVDDVWISVVAAALCGACLGFLPHNLASPSRIFLGDGGSMPVGFVVAALVMVGASSAAPAWQPLLVGLLLVGVPTLDTCLVVISRTRRRVPVFLGGRDHLTHRTRERLRTARAVAVALGGAQALISATVLVAVEAGSSALAFVTGLYIVALGSTIAVLDAPAPGAGDRSRSGVDVATRPSRLPPPHRLLLAALGVLVGLSPFFGGYYDSALWVPAGLGLLVALTAGLIARPPRLSGSGALAVIGLGGLAAVSLVSAVWAESVEQAVLEGNRYIVYTAFFGLLLVLLRDRDDARWLVGSLLVSGLVGAIAVVVRLLDSESATAFLSGRLNEPFGYINGQGSFFVLALFPALALAEHRRAVPAACGLALATLMAALALLSQSRGVALAVLVPLVLVLLAVPGRLRRAWAVAVAVVALVLAGPALLDVYELSSTGEATAGTIRSAAIAAVTAAIGAGIAWGLLTLAAERLERGGRRPPARTVATAVLAVGCAVVLVGATANAGRIATTAKAQVQAFTLRSEPAPTGPGAAANTRLVSGAGNRYDYWRVAYRAWSAEPVLGVGAGNYDRPYFANRTTPEDIRQPHSVELQVLSETGLPGVLFLLILFGAIVAGIDRLARPAATSRSARALLVGGAGTVVAWLVHSSVDWMHLLPGLSGMALAGLAVLVMSGREPSGHRPRLGIAVLLAVLIAVSGLSLTRQGLAEHFRSSAQDQLAQRPADALTSVNRSLRLDSEAVGAYYVQAAAFARYGEASAARESLLTAARKEPSDFVTWTLLGDLAVRRGRLAEARRQYGRAAALNPMDVGLRGLAADPAAAATLP